MDDALDDLNPHDSYNARHEPKRDTRTEGDLIRTRTTKLVLSENFLKEVLSRYFRLSEEDSELQIFRDSTGRHAIYLSETIEIKPGEGLRYER